MQMQVKETIVEREKERACAGSVSFRVVVVVVGEESGGKQ